MNGRAAAAALAVGCAFGAYAVLRYAGVWMESDTTEFVRHTRHVLAFGPASDGAYPHGYAYTTWAAILSQLTGLDPMPLFQRFTPFLGNVLLALFGFTTFRDWLGSDRLGLAATVTLFLVPELVFTVTRGSHEKFTIALTLLAALAALKIFRLATGESPPRVFASWLITFYVVAFTTVSMNVFFGSAFIAASTLALALAWGLAALSRRVRPRLVTLRRELVLMVTTAWILVAFVMFYAYPTASQNLTLLGNVIDRLAVLFLTFEPSSDPYALVGAAWASPPVYAIVSSFRWLLFGISFVGWGVLLALLFRRPERSGLDQITLLAFYGAFGFQLALAIPVDFVGLAAGSNLQVRLYTYFALFAAPMAVTGLAAAGLRLRQRDGRVPPWLAVPGLALVAAFAVISALKSTVDPSVSNDWVFYRSSEVAAVAFWDQTQAFDALWVGVTPRVLHAHRAVVGDDSVAGNRFNRSPESDLGRDGHALASDVVTAEAVARGLPLSPVLADDRVYDNGEAQIFHRLPRTPYQR